MVCRFIISLLMFIFILVTPLGWCGSPYSANGIGVLIPDDFGISRGLGGAGIALDNGRNALRENPALIASFTKPSYSFDVVYNRTTTYTGGTEQPTFGKLSPRLFKFVFPLSKRVVIGWGLTPLSQTDVSMVIPGDGFSDRVKVTGGVNVSTTSIAVSFKDFLRLGVSLNYNFGAIQEEWETTFPDATDLHQSTDTLRRKFKGYSVSLGAITHVIPHLTIGLGYTGSSDMDLTISVQPEDITDSETIHTKKTISLPSIVRFGVSSSFGKRVITVLDVSLAQWEKAAKTTKEKEMYNDTYTVGTGIRFIPSTSMTAPYYQTLPLSLGFKVGTMYYKSYPIVDTVLEKAITGGIEFPFKKSPGSLFVSAEVGTRGDKEKNGWDETYIIFGLSLLGTIK